MATIPAYEHDPTLRELQVEILEVGEDRGQHWACLDDTILYPEGGGQGADHGWLGGVRVLDVRRHGGMVRHLLAAPIALGPALLRLDWERRFDHMQQHTAQHLLTAVALARFGWPTTAFHLGLEVSDIELGVPTLARDQLDALEETVATEIRAAHPVRCFRASREEAARLSVRSRLLPEGLVGDLRLVEIAGVDLNTCGGTHVSSTAEIEAAKLLGTEPLRGGTRVFFVAGGRLRRRLGEQEVRNAALRGLLDTGESDFVATITLKLGQLHDAERRLRATEEELAEAHARALAGSEATVLHASFEGRDAAFLQRIARRLQADAPTKAVLLTSGTQGAGTFVLVGGDRVRVDVAATGRAIAGVLSGRGGGTGRVYQGKAGTLQATDKALELLWAAVEETR